MIPFSTYSKIHLVGIKGVAMASLAQILADLGKTVTGSDVKEDFVTAEILRARGFTITVGFDGAHIAPDCSLVVYTGAHNGKQNIEVQAARERGIPVMSHAEALGVCMEGKRGISVCGTGGKSTTSAMIAWILHYAGKKPSYAIGVGNVPNLGSTGHYDVESEWFVAEADEYAVDPTDDHRPRFIYQHPELIVCTNLSFDHPDIYPDFETMKRTFSDFFNTIPENGALITSENVPSILPSVRVIVPENTRIELPLPGIHNQENAQLALSVSKLCGVDEETALEALKIFQSTMRRFEYKGKLGEVEFFDDYAHTPDEIRSTLQAVREKFPTNRIVVAFQPHTYSRTKALFDDFVHALSQADSVLILDIFASAREAVDRTISADLLRSKLHNSPMKLRDYDELAAKLPEILKDNDVCITMGAGDIYKVYEKMEGLH